MRIFEVTLTYHIEAESSTKALDKCLLCAPVGSPEEHHVEPLILTMDEEEV